MRRTRVAAMRTRSAGLRTRYADGHRCHYRPERVWIWAIGAEWFSNPDYSRRPERDRENHCRNIATGNLAFQRCVTLPRLSPRSKFRQDRPLLVPAYQVEGPAARGFNANGVASRSPGSRSYPGFCRGSSRLYPNGVATRRVLGAPGAACACADQGVGHQRTQTRGPISVSEIRILGFGFVWYFGFRDSDFGIQHRQFCADLSPVRTSTGNHGPLGMPLTGALPKLPRPWAVPAVPRSFGRPGRPGSLRPRFRRSRLTTVRCRSGTPRGVRAGD